MAKFKVGDKVRVRKYIKFGDLGSGKYVNAAMEARAGEIVTIAEVGRLNYIKNPSGEGRRYYKIREDGELWYWWKDTLEPYYEHGIVGKVFSDLPHGPQYAHYDTWFSLESTPKKLRKKAVLFKCGRDMAPGRYKCIGVAPYEQDSTRLVACLKNVDTEHVYLYVARELPGYEE